MVEIRSFCGLCAFVSTFLIWLFYGYTNVNFIEIKRTRRFLVPLQGPEGQLHEVVQNVCHLQRDVDRIKAQAKHFMVDQVHKVAYCRHGKVGTTTWMKHFTNLIPPNRQNVIDWKHLNSPQLHARIPQEFSSKFIEKNLQPGQSLNDYFRQEGYFVFSFVRHPFDRLVSAYLDKIEGKGPMGEKGYRKLRFKLVEDYGSVNFQSFLKHVRATLQNYEKCIYAGQNKKCDSGIDVHWRPFYQRCAYCDMSYDFIGRMENFGADVMEVVERANLTSDISVEEALGLQSHFTSNDSLQHGQNTKLEEALALPIKASPRALEYFAKVDKSLIKDLLKLYLKDFQLFQYSSEGF